MFTLHIAVLRHTANICQITKNSKNWCYILLFIQKWTEVKLQPPFLFVLTNLRIGKCSETVMSSRIGKPTANSFTLNSSRPESATDPQLLVRRRGRWACVLCTWRDGRWACVLCNDVILQINAYGLTPTQDSRLPTPLCLDSFNYQSAKLKNYQCPCLGVPTARHSFLNLASLASPSPPPLFNIDSRSGAYTFVHITGSTSTQGKRKVFRHSQEVVTVTTLNFDARCFHGVMESTIGWTFFLYQPRSRRKASVIQGLVITTPINPHGMSPSCRP